MVVISTVAAFQRGFIRVLLSVGGLFAGIIIASWEYPQVAAQLNRWISNFQAAEIASFLLILVLVMVVFQPGGKPRQKDRAGGRAWVCGPSARCRHRVHPRITAGSGRDDGRNRLCSRLDLGATFSAGTLFPKRGSCGILRGARTFSGSDFGWSQVPVARDSGASQAPHVAAAHVRRTRVQPGRAARVRTILKRELDGLVSQMHSAGISYCRGGPAVQTPLPA